MSTQYNRGHKKRINCLDHQRDLLKASSFYSLPKDINTPEEASRIYGGVGEAIPISQTAFTPTDTTYHPQSDQQESRWSGSVQTLLNQPPATLPQQFIAGGMIFCIAFGSWAWFGTIEEVGKAQGKLVPAGETYKIQPIELGKVTEIAVKEGQTVEAGQLLAELDTELAQKEIDRLQQMILAYQAELTQKHSLRERVALESQTEAAIASAEIQAQQAAIAHGQEKIATIRQLLAQQQIEASAYQSRQTQLQPLSTTAQEKLAQLEAEKQAHQARIDRLKPLLEEGAISQEFIFQAQQALRETEQRITSSRLQEVNQANEQLFQADQSLRDLKSQLTEHQGELFVAQKTVQQSQAELARKKAEAEQKQVQTTQRIQQLEVEITQLQGKIAETETLLVAAKTQLQHKYLKAPVNGVILSLNLKNTGEVLEAGQTVAEIAPHGVPLVVSAVLPNQEAGFVKSGMPVKIKLDAYPYQDYGVIPGQVTEISADAESDEKLGEIYQVEMKLERDHILENQQTIPFKPGQTVTADIIIRRRRIVDLLLDPIKQLQKDGINL